MSTLQKQFREGMANLGAAVNVVTSAGEAGTVGFTATAVCSVSDTPPLLAVFMNRDSAQNPVLRANGRLCVNVLPADRQDVGAVFAGRSALLGQDRFSTAQWRQGGESSPILEDALASFDCTISECLEYGSHTLFLALVREVRVAAGGKDGLVYFQRGFHRICGGTLLAGTGA